jgi:predicted HTH transcriptional regulator
LQFTENRELVMNAIDERGAEDEKAIRKATGLDAKTIERVIADLVEENLYEWVSKGGKKDDERGTRSQYLHKVGTPIGT